MLKVRDLTVRYRDATAVSRVSLDVAAREIVAVVGTNGAGKSSLGQAVAGLVPAAAGSVVELDGADVSRTGSESRVRAGLVYVPEGRRVFSKLTVEDNLRAGAFVRRRAGAWEARRDEMFERLPRLRERRHVQAGLLSGGEQQLLAICRALMAKPKLLVLDEPSLGLAPVAINTVAEFLRELVERDGVSVLLLEQNASFASRVAQRAWVLRLGAVAATLSQEQVADPEVLRDVLVG